MLITLFLCYILMLYMIIITTKVFNMVVSKFEGAKRIRDKYKSVMNVNKPFFVTGVIKNNGEYGRLAEIVNVFKSNTTLTKPEIFTIMTGVVSRGNRSGHLTAYFALLNINDIVSYDTSIKRWVRGNRYDEFIIDMKYLHHKHKTSHLRNEKR
jgi:hypothetical protein